MVLPFEHLNLLRRTVVNTGVDLFELAIDGLEDWGRSKANKAGLEPLEVAYESDRASLTFTFDGAQSKAKLEKLETLLRTSDYIKAPWRCDVFRYSTYEYATSSFERCWTMTFITE
jgi:hypothetical protein